MTKGVVVKPILTKEFSSLGQMDLIDMHSMAQSNGLWYLYLICILRTLRTKRLAEVAFQLMNIFLTLGATAILQSDNGSEFTTQVITELKGVWPNLVLVHGKPRK